MTSGEQARTQRETVLRHLQTGEGLTQAAAAEKYGIGRLAPRVLELRRQGWPIEDRPYDTASGGIASRYFLADTAKRPMAAEPDGYLAPCFEHCPEALKTRPWVLWKAEDVGRPKKAKVPYAVTGCRASATDPGTWARFEDVRAAYDAGGYNGVGLVLTGDGLCGIDLDDVMQGGNIHPVAMEIVQRLGSYTERSVSGTGVHVLVRGTLPWPGKRKEELEVYGSKRYLCWTGAVLPGFECIKTNQKALDHVARLVAPQRPQPKALQRARWGAVELDDDALLLKARASAHGKKLADLFSGAWEAYYPSQSEADCWLLARLLHWTRGDETRAMELFGRSALAQREKWQRPDYQRRTLEAVRCSR